MNLALPSLSTKKVMAAAFVFLSLLLAAYGPIAPMNAYALAEVQTLNELKDEAVEEIERRISNYTETEKTLTINLKLSRENSSLNVDYSNNKTSTSTDSEDEEAGQSTSLSSSIREKVLQMVQKVVEQLKALKEKVLETNSLSSMESLADNIDSQFQITQLVDVQGLISKAIDSLSSVFEQIMSIKDKLKGQIAKIKECFASKNAELDVNAEASSDGVNVDASASTSEVDCSNLNSDSQDVINGAESRMSGLSTITSAIKTILQSAISLFMTLMTTFTGLLSGLGGGGAGGGAGGFSEILSTLTGLFDIGNLSSLLGGLGGGAGGLGGSLGSLGSLGGLMTSFTSILPQLSNAGGMAGNLSGLMSSLTGFMNM